MKKRLLLPWEKKYTIVCPKCGGKVETYPLWHWQKRSDKLEELQRDFCHALDSEFLEKIPVLTQNDWESKQKWDAFRKDLTYDFAGYRFALTRPYEETKDLFTIQNGLPKIFLKHGIFALIGLFTETELKILFLFLCLEPNKCPKQVWFKIVADISRSYVSTILKKLSEWRLIKAWKTQTKGRASGRQLAYTVNEEVRKILDQNLREHEFLRESMLRSVKPIVQMHTKVPWRKDIDWSDQKDTEPNTL